ncbi:MAG: hypothetical protein IJ418_14405 [Clostridia bacterium]|nr:hypothetical protein [Clostridia bacterium]
MQYKCVRGTAHLTVAKSSEIDDAVAEIASILNRETVGGWEFDNVFPLSLTKNAAVGGIGARMNNFFGGDSLADGEYTVNVYVFKKP